jgi:hypothetical protein
MSGGLPDRRRSDFALADLYRDLVIVAGSSCLRDVAGLVLDRPQACALRPLPFCTNSMIRLRLLRRVAQPQEQHH